MDDTKIKLKLKRFVLLDNNKIIDLETIKCDWYSWGDYYTEKIDVIDGFLYKHTSKKVEPFEHQDMGTRYIVDMFPRNKKLGFIVGTGDTIETIETIEKIQ